MRFNQYNRENEHKKNIYERISRLLVTAGDARYVSPNRSEINFSTLCFLTIK